MSRFDDKLFDELLDKAFNEQYNEEIQSAPAIEELKAEYPFTDKHMADAVRLTRKNRKPLWAGYIGKAAAVLLCLSLAGFGLVMTDPGIRATVGDSIVKYIEEGFNIDFTEAKDSASIDIDETLIGYIPDGFELLPERTEEKEDSLSYSYMNADGKYIVIDILASSDIELITEDEHHDLKLHHIGGYTGYISYSESQRSGSVYFGNRSFTVAISGMTDRAELIKIAENIEIKE